MRYGAEFQIPRRLLASEQAAELRRFIAEAALYIQRQEWPPVRIAEVSAGPYGAERIMVTLELHETSLSDYDLARDPQDRGPLVLTDL